QRSDIPRNAERADAQRVDQRGTIDHYLSMEKFALANCERTEGVRGQVTEAPVAGGQGDEAADAGLSRHGGIRPDLALAYAPGRQSADAVCRCDQRVSQLALDIECAYGRRGGAGKIRGDATVRQVTIEQGAGRGDLRRSVDVECADGAGSQIAVAPAAS